MIDARDSKRAPGTIGSAQHWRLTRRMTWQLLIVWFVLTFGIIFFARQLDRYTVFGWPLSFYLAAQGATLGYLALIGGYVWRMRQLDRRYRADPQEDATEQAAQGDTPMTSGPNRERI